MVGVRRLSGIGTELRGALALFWSVFTGVYALVELWKYGPKVDVPLWLVGVVTTTIAFYFAGHAPSSEASATMNRTVDTLASKITNGTTAAPAPVEVTPP